MESNAGVGDLIQSAVRESSAQLLQDLDQLVSTRMDALKQEMSDNSSKQYEAQISTINNLKFGERPVFKKRGNEEQYKHNSKVADKLLAASTSIQEDQQQKAKERILEGIQLIERRQKLIKLADKSEIGWKLVDEYETNELADDSDDERRINKAEARAKRKVKENSFRKRRRIDSNRDESPAAPVNIRNGSFRQAPPAHLDITLLGGFYRETARHLFRLREIRTLESRMQSEQRQRRSRR